MRKAFSLLLVLALLCGMAAAQEAEFSLTEDSCIFLVVSQEPTQEQTALMNLLALDFSAAGFDLPLCWGLADSAPAGAICLLPSSQLEAEHYTMELTPGRVSIYGDSRGLLYGARELLRRLRLGSGLQTGSFSDGPDTAERGLMIDCARKYWSLPWLKNLIAQMSYLGYNTLQLHMAEDQGIRWDIWSEGADSNGNDFSFLIGYDSGWNTDYPDPNAEHFYTAQELRELVSFAQAYGIDVIADYDMPSHCNVLTKRYAAYVQEHPDFSFSYAGVTYSAAGMSCDGVTLPYDTALWPNADFFSVRVGSTPATLDVTNPVGRALGLALAQAYGEFFRDLGCTAYHFGFDELNVSDGDGWADFARTHVSGGQTAADTAADFANELAALLKSLGYTSIRAFNDVLYDDARSIALNPELALYVWSISGDWEVERYQRDGRVLFNCLQNYCYYALRYIDRANGGDARDGENYWWSFHHATPKRIFEEWSPARMYNYDVQGSSLTAAPGGGYFLIWSDFGGWRTEQEVWEGDAGGAYNLIDRLWSNAAKQWDWMLAQRMEFEEFAALRDTLRCFPGFIDCETEPATPGGAALTCVAAAEHTALRAAIARTEVTREEAAFTLESYASFWRALETARATDAALLSTQEEVDAATAALTRSAQELCFAPAQIVISVVRGDQKITALRGKAFFGAFYLLPLPALAQEEGARLSGGILLPDGYAMGMATAQAQLVLPET